MKNVVDRFWSKVDKSGECWIWAASLDEHGYGQFRLNGRTQKATRVAHDLFKFPVPRDLHVLHNCDNPACVRPEHLFLGTQKENGEDMQKKKRSPWGERNGLAKLSAQQVLEIRETLEANKGIRGIQTRLAERFGVGQDQISRIASGKRWSQLDAKSLIKLSA